MLGLVEAAIRTALRSLEAETGLRVLHAVESGSRAWGFPSLDSDWDVRFIFAWPRERYLRVQLPEATLTRQFPGDLDMGGWDLRMALTHFAKSNASFLEWLASPIIYHRDPKFAGELEPLREVFFQPRVAMDHYLGLARSLWLAAGDGAVLNGKKCLYVVRAVVAAQWVLEKRSQPPVPFLELLAPVEAAGHGREIDALLAAKAAGSEGDAFVVSDGLRGFLSERREELEAAASSIPARPVDLGPLDTVFQGTLERLAGEAVDDDR